MNVTIHPQPKASDFYSTYINEFSRVSSYFAYHYGKNEWQQRFNDLSYPSEQRAGLVQTIRSSMETVSLSEAQEKNLSLLEKEAYVTITGQQTGLLTGPIYSIHKAVTAIVLANQLTESTHQPVVPVFWMAGEDHDILEVNHFYIEKNREVTKLSLSVPQLSTEMVADQEVDAEEIQALLQQAFLSLPETSHTKKLWDFLIQLTSEGITYKEFFLHAFHQFFHQYGLLFVNSSDVGMRQLGKEFTKQLIQNNAALRHAVYEKEQLLPQDGFGFPIQCRLENAHLFYVHNQHRYLLEATEGGFTNQELGRTWTEEELISEVDRNPACISHNVVTRPLMQQFLFPVHTFVGGPGEIAYWALLKEAFEIMGLTMPIVAPRLSFTILPLSIEEKMKELHLSLEDVWAGNIPHALQHFIDQQKNEEITQDLRAMNEWLQQKYKDLSDKLETEDIHLNPLVVKNQNIHQTQFRFLEQAIEDIYYRRFDATVASYKAIENEIVPLGSLQERIYSPLHYFNQYGFELVDLILSQSYEVDGQHYVLHTH